MIIYFIFFYPIRFSHSPIFRQKMSEPTAQQQQQQPQNGKERSKSTEEKEIPREPALVCKDINVRNPLSLFIF